MHNLTSTIAVPNINRMEVVAVEVRGKISTAYVYVEVLGVGGVRYPNDSTIYELAITNGTCQGLRAKASPTGYADNVETFAKTLASGFTDLVAQYRAGANDSTGRRNVEVWMASAPVALFPAGT